MSGVQMLFSKDYAKLVWDNQRYMLHYHANVTATHPYSSRWYQWIADIRPILYYQDFPSSSTKRAIVAFLSPLVCWGGLLAVFATAWLGIRKRDRAALFLIVGYLAQLVPWLGVTRIVFEYHYFPCLPFLVLSLCYVFDALRGLDKKWARRMLCFAGAGVVLFALFYPVLTGLETPQTYTYKLLKWLPSWPI
jgi:dolichyl-phosphate-mannose--protein O-mannosyl transferase